MKIHSLLPVLATLASCAFMIVHARENDRSATTILDAIRRGDTQRVVTLIREKASIQQIDERGNSALHWAALSGQADLVQRLLQAGADPNTTNHAGATPLFYGASDVRTVAVLLDHGANPNSVSMAGNTPLMAAAAYEHSFPSVKRLVESGADVKTTRKDGTSTLAIASQAGDLRTVEFLLKHGANVNPTVTNALTPITAAAFAGDAKLVRRLLDHGANPNVDAGFAGHALNFALYSHHGDVARLLIERGADLHFASPIGDRAPPIVWSAYNETGDDSVARFLLTKGVDVNEPAESGETALRWAMKRGDTPLVDFLRQRGGNEGTSRVKQKEVPNRSVPSEAASRRSMIADAVQRSVTLVERSSTAFLGNGFVQKQNCVSCHQQTLPAVAFGLARERGFRVDEAQLRNQVRAQVRSWSARQDRAYEMDEPQPDAPVNLGYGLLGLSALGYPADELTAAMVWYLAAVQLDDGSWPSYDRRPPMEDGFVVGAALSVRALQSFPLPGREKEFAGRVDRARRWLAKSKPENTNQRAFQLLGLGWAGEKVARLRPLVDRILSDQRPDGGWAQLPGRESDAWATGQTLVALHQAGGMPTSHPDFQRGVEFLLRTQFDDGSWWVRSRTWPFQPHFDSDFPHGKDQWISAGGTAWSAMALLLTIEPPVKVAAMNWR
jgi:ankyrin repeat protein